MRRATVITVSTRAAAGVYADEAGPAVAELLRQRGYAVGDIRVVPDGRALVATEIRDACGDADLVVTSGGTGLHPRDETPEATLDVLDREAPGYAETIRSDARGHTPLGILTRGVSGVRGRTLIVNFPGNPKAIDQSWPVVQPTLAHAAQTLERGS